MTHESVPAELGDYQSFRAATSASAFAEVEAALAGPDQRTEFPKRLALDDITARRNLFQPRAGLDRDHVKAIADALRRGETLPPLTVFAAGPTIYLLDGHHRWSALKRAGRKVATVQWFKGSLAEAMLKAMEANARHGLNATRRERMDAAWRLVALADDGAPPTNVKIAHDSGVHRNTIDKMRRIKKALGPERAREMGAWRDAQKEIEEYQAMDFDLGKTAKELANKISAAVGGMMRENPTVAEAALELYFGKRWEGFLDHLDDQRRMYREDMMEQPEDPDENPDF